MPKTIFIASSGQSLNYARAVEAYFKKERYLVKIWTRAVKPSEILIDKLIEQISNCDFAIFLFTTDDITISKGKEHKSVRDNVLFELGIGIGKIGRQNCFLIREEGTGGETKIPSDLNGVIYSSFNGPQVKSIETMRGAIEPSCYELLESMESRINTHNRNSAEKPAVHRLIDSTLHSICRAVQMPDAADEFRAFYFEKVDNLLVCVCHWSLNPVVNQEDRVVFDLEDEDLPNIAVVRSGKRNLKLQYDDIKPSEQMKLAEYKPVSSDLKYVVSKAVLSDNGAVMGVISIDTNSLKGTSILAKDDHRITDYMIENTAHLFRELYRHYSQP